jgi:arylsulfatase
MALDTFGGTIGRTAEESVPWWPSLQRPQPDSPNVVMIVLDDVGFAQLGCYGSNIRTPNMDSLAAEGLRYTNFHTTALCSPTRACLLTGRNHHSVGMGTLANWNIGFPGSCGTVTHRAATLAEILRGGGYNTIATGKWHLIPVEQQTPAGPYDQWPLQRGFERYYGFLDAVTSQWDPELTCDNQRIEAPKRPDYHLSEDLVDRSIEYLRNQTSWAPEKPFFLYLAFGAGHEPHHAPAAYIDGYRGTFDHGWDACREEWLERQKEMGIVPSDTVLPPRNPGVQAWADLSSDERLVFTRLQEAFAGMLEHADHQIGRLVRFLEQVERRDNTIVIVVSDNGASQEGSLVGTFNTIRAHNRIEDSVEDNLAHIETVGTPRGNSNYPLGWAMAGNTPCKWYKQNTHGGGIRDPFIISWPKGISSRGGIRTQFHHAIDVVPTILEISGVELPESHNGVAQMPIEGISMRYSFDQPDVSTQKRTQYFEMMGHRGIYSEGWKAVTHHDAGQPFDDDTWELYHLEEDFSESEDLAEAHPEKLKALIELWWAEAGRYQVLPIDDRFFERWDVPPVPGSMKDRSRYILYRGISHVGPDVGPNLRDVSHSISARIQRKSGEEGVLVAHGGCSGGYSLYIKDDHLVYHYNCAGVHYAVRSQSTLGEGELEVRMAFAKTGRCRGRVTLFVDGDEIGAGDVDRTLPYSLSVEGFDVGKDDLTPVTDEYESPFPFEGTFDHVVIDIEDDRQRDPAGELESALGRQ